MPGSTENATCTGKLQTDLKVTIVRNSADGPDRRLSALFQLSKHWKDYDFFARSKSSAFRTSRDAILELAAQYKTLIQQIGANKDATHDVEAEKLLFMEMAEICLWGNATDLSLLPNLSYDDIQKLQGAEARKLAENNILVNDLPAAFEILKKAQSEGKAERRVDIVLDNAGFELYVDLVLAGYLLSAGLATQIIIHPKSIPWYVSDVLPTDFSDLLNSISNPRAFFETQSEDEALQDKTPAPLSDVEVENMQFLFQEWISHHAEGRLVMRPNRYWTAAGSFWRLPAEAPELHNDLKESELVIFKGDLNYRKLTADVSNYSHIHIPFLGCILISHSSRPCGTLQLPSLRQLVPWVLARVSMSCHCALVKLTLWSACLKARTRSCDNKKAVVVTAAQESGLGAASGLLSPFLRANRRFFD